ncbi:MAG: hypothetical protein J7M05_14440 [Anaerolineae bacterium]|nr:hypothetical protein [Anaerolineae bacterium]
MNADETLFMRMLRGERSPHTPFWEVWFAMPEFCRRHWGDYSLIENRIAMAKNLGMAAVRIDGVPTDVHFIDRRHVEGSSAYYGGGLLTSREQLAQRPLPDWTAEIPKWKREIELVHKAGLACWMVLPWCFHAVATSMGLAQFALRCYDDPDFVQEAMAWVEERNRAAIDQVIAQVRPDLVLFDGDCAYKTGTMVSPQMLRELTYEQTALTVAKLRALDIPYAFHSDGKADGFLPMIIELGFSAFHGCEKAANDLGHLVEAYGDDIVLVGNMDVVFLSQATPEQVREETRRMLEIGSAKGRFMGACNTSPQDYIPEENYFAMAEVIREF